MHAAAVHQHLHHSVCAHRQPVARTNIQLHDVAVCVVRRVVAVVSALAAALHRRFSRELEADGVQKAVYGLGVYGTVAMYKWAGVLRESWVRCWRPLLPTALYPSWHAHSERAVLFKRLH